jgi:hypothetical protein
MDLFGWKLSLESKQRNQDWHVPGMNGHGPKLRFQVANEDRTWSITVLQNGADLDTRVMLVGAVPMTNTLEQLIKRKTDSWHACQDADGLIHHELAFSYWDADRVRSKRVTELSDVDDFNPAFRSFCESQDIPMLPHQEVYPEAEASSHTGKLCVMTDADAYEKLAGIYIGQKIVSVYRAG